MSGERKSGWALTKDNDTYRKKMMVDTWWESVEVLR